MATAKQTSSLQTDDHFPITPSDTLDIKDDGGNTNGYDWCYVHNAGSTGGQLRVAAVGGGIAKMYLNPGQTGELKVKRVYATNPAPPSDLVGRVGFKGY